MTNFTIFNTPDLDALITPYVGGMTSFITPIKYEAITPDIFAFLFRTTGNDNSDHFFVSLQFDYIESLDEAKEIIEKWHGTVLEFLEPEAQTDSTEPRIKLNEVYQALLAVVDPPRGDNYWSNNIVIYSQDEAEGIIATMPESYRDNVRKGVASIYRDYPEAAISVYLRADGKTEYFFK